MLPPTALAAFAFLLSFPLFDLPLAVNAGLVTSLSKKSDDSFWNQGSKLGLAWPDGNAPYLKNLKGINKYVLLSSVPDTR
jgi:hypothetical protein